MAIVISGYDTINDTYARGEVAEVEIYIHNDDSKIQEITFEYSITKKFLWFPVTVSNHSEVIHENIPVHMKKSVGRGIKMPEKWLALLPLKGEIELTVTVRINGDVVGNVVKTIAVV